MGYPASAALLFKALTEEDNRSLHREAKEIISKFSLFAIILADPVKDPLFYQELQLNFPFYDRLTGKNFMFFSIIKEADSEFFDGAYKQFKIFNNIEAYKQNHAAEYTKHSELALHAICAILGVNYDETPSLIISNDLQFGNFCKINTNVNNLEPQLIALRGVADNKMYNKGYSLFEILIRFNNQQYFFDDIEMLSINKQPIKALSELLQVISSEGIFNDKTLYDLRQNLESSLVSVREDTKERVTEALSLLMIQDKRINQNKIKLREPLYGIPPVNVSEKLSKEWIDIQNSTKNYLAAATHISKYMYSMFREMNDYSLLTLPMCKSFETEINLSVVQLMRKEFGVPMPSFFHKYFPQMNNIPIKPSESLVQNPREIYLNKEKNGKWLPPGLGESKLVFATIRQQSPELANGWQPADKIEILIENWGLIQKVRNMTTHSEPVSKNEKNTLEDCLYRLHKNGLLNGLTSLKNSLSH
jgi:hypothetical protein